MKRAKYIIISFLIITSFIGAITEDKSFVSHLIKQLKNYIEKLPEEKVYLQTDKNLYRPGEIIWFKAHVVKPTNNNPSFLCKTLNTFLVDESGNEIIDEIFIINNGIVKGSLLLDSTFADGNYKLIAYSSWMKNLDAKDAFCKNVFIRKHIPPPFIIQVSLNDSLYFPSDTLKAELLMISLEGKPIEKHKFEFVLRTLDKIVKKGKGKTNESGKASINLLLTEKYLADKIFLDITSEYLNYPQRVSILVPTPDYKVDLQFFPEGGEMINGMETKVAFKAVDNEGNPFDFEGEIFKNNSEVVASVKSFYLGMGVFKLIPQKTDSLKLRIIKPSGITSLYPLPKTIPEGHTLLITDRRRDTLTVKVQSSETKRWNDLYLIAQVRGRIYWYTPNAFKGDTIIEIPTKFFPAGIAQITLFDGQYIPHAERLVFVNKHKRMYIDIIPDKETYDPREKVVLNIEVKDENDNPILADLCLSVVEKNRLRNINKEPNIQSYLLLNPQLNGKIFNPNFYLQNTEKADQALDLLLMTHGWRRFKWEDILSFDETKGSSYINQDYIHGVVYNSRGKPVVNAQFSVLKTLGNWEYYGTKTDVSGKFQIPSEVYLEMGKSNLSVQAVAPNGNVNLNIEFDNTFLVKTIDYYVLNEIESEEIDFGNKDEKKQKIETKGTKLIVTEPFNIKDYFSSITEGSILIEEVSIKGRKPLANIPPEEFRRKYVEFKKKGDELYPIFGDFVSLLRQVNPAFLIRDDKIIFRGRTTFQGKPQGALIIIDGIPINFDPETSMSDLDELINSSDIAEIKITPSPGAALKYSGQFMGGLIEIKTKGSKEYFDELRKKEMEPGESYITLLRGFRISREFYSPSYDLRFADSLTEEDVRSTIYWNPEVHVDNTGIAQVTFFNSDVKTSIKGTVEGIGVGGRLGTSTFNYNVKPDTIKLYIDKNK